MSAIFMRALASGALAAAASAGILAVCARRSGASGIQPLNATSHVLHGAGAARRSGVDLPHTALGAVTHLGACVFWALLFETLRARSPSRPAVLDAATTVTLAAVVDYGLVPRRLTPGWELLLGRGGIAFGYAGMAAGFLAAVMMRGRADAGAQPRAGNGPRHRLSGRRP